MGGGGYAAGPVGLAALIARGVPLVLTEADSRLGLDQPRARARRPARVPGVPARRPRGPRFLVTGRPIPVPDADRESARARLGHRRARAALRARVRRVARAPARSTSRRSRASRRSREASCRVLHICGRRDYPSCAYADALERSYDLREYMQLEDFADALAASDLVGGARRRLDLRDRRPRTAGDARALPHAAGDHQGANARWMADAGAAVVIADEQLTAARLAREVARLLAEPEPLAAMAAASRGARPPRSGRKTWPAELLRRRRGGACAGADERPRARAGTHRALAERPGGPWSGRRLHLVGVGGAGMSAYARAAAALGASVTRLRPQRHALLRAAARRRRARGRDRRHDAANVPAGEDVELVHSSAVGPTIPSCVAARERGPARAARGRSCSAS